MTYKSFFAVLFSALLLTTSCSKEEFFDGDFSNEPKSSLQSTSKINVTGETNGISYSLKGLSINSGVVAINEGNATINSNLQEINNGFLKLSVISDEIVGSLNKGVILYVKTDNFTVLKKITAVEKSGTDAYLLSIEQAQLGEVFDEGTIDMSVDLNNSFLRSAAVSKYHEINLYEEYDLGGGVKFNPMTDIKMVYNFKLAFIKNQVLPSEFSSSFEFQVDLNPDLKFGASINKISAFELTKYIPSSFLDFIKSFEIDYDIPINTLGIETLPAKIKIRDINIPLIIEANLSKGSALIYGLNGSFKLGYKININGLKATTTPVYEGSFASSAPLAYSDMYGELLTDLKIVISPAVTILNGAYTAGGDLTLETATTTYGNISLPNKPVVSGTKGTAKISANILVDLILLKIPVNVLNQEIELWDLGKIVKSVTYSDMTYKVSSSYTTNLLITSRLYTTDFTMKYKYPILGKKVPEKLLISYDVFQDNGTTKITSVTDQEISLTGITADSFKFQLGIPFKLGGLLLTTPQSKSFIKNIVIKDSKGYVYSGIFNSSKNIVENEFEIKR